jgi:GTP-dependent phosphoenolpyruvate carboxykinase
VLLSHPHGLAASFPILFGTELAMMRHRIKGWSAGLVCRLGHLGRIY